MKTIDDIAPEWISIKTAERITNLGHTKMYELIRDNVIESRKVGKRRLLRLRSVRALGQAT